MSIESQLERLVAHKPRYCLPLHLLSRIYQLADIDTRLSLCKYLDRPDYSGCYYVSEAYVDCTLTWGPSLERRVVAPSKALMKRNKLTNISPSLVYSAVDGVPTVTLENPPISLQRFKVPKHKVTVCEQMVSDILGDADSYLL